MKKLSIPQFINMYNYFMGGVDEADQLRSYYNTQRTHLKSWKSLYHFLLDTTIVNCYKLSAGSIPSHWPKRSAHKAFREDLVEALFDHGERLTNPPGRVAIMEEKDIHKAPVEEHRQGPIRLFPKKPSCAAYITAGRDTIKEGFKRKSLIELSVNTI
jgi:Transposase IS4